jgi:CubicO group peptidase (beta-lactamase class C family)
MRGAPPPPEAQVTLANWREPPFSRWAFRHVREIVPSAHIGTGGRTWRLAREARPLERIAFEAPDGREMTVSQLLEESHSHGLVVLKGGQIVYERYDGGHDAETPHIVFSVSKSVTGLVAGILAERRLLDHDAPVSRYLPEAQGSAYGDCTVRHVLDMTVAVEFEESYLDPKGVFARYRVATAWNPPVQAGEVLDLRNFLVELKRAKGRHGEAFRYASPNSDLLGWVLERASGLRLAKLLSTFLWRPMGAEFDAYVTVDRLGAARSAGGICMSLRDMARVGELMRCFGLANGRQVVPAWWVDDILENGDREAWVKGDLRQLLPDGRYRSQWYLTGNDHGALCAIGIHGQWIYIDPVAAVVIAKQSAQALPVDDRLDQLHLRVFDAIARGIR